MKFNKIELEVKNALSSLPIKKRGILYIAGNIFNFGLKKNEVHLFCNNLLKYAQKKIGSSGGIIVPTATLNLIKSKKIFDKKKTQSFTMGVFSEFIRKHKKSSRSDHPLWSFSGIGKNVKKVLHKVSYSAYGEESVFERLLNFKTYFICLGEPNTAIGMIHYVENLIGVPYRYNKEFYIKVKSKNRTIFKYTLLGVRFKSKNMIGDGNKEITNQLKKMGTFKFVRLRKGVIYFCEYKKIIKNLKIIFRKNPRIWLKNKNQKQQTYYKD